MWNQLLNIVGNIKELRDVDFNCVAWGGHLTTLGFIRSFIHLYLLYIFFTDIPQGSTMACP